MVLLCVGNSQWCSYNTLSKSDWLLNSQLGVLQAEWLIFERKEKATLNFNLRYSETVFSYAVTIGCYDISKIYMMLQHDFLTGTLLCLFIAKLCGRRLTNDQ